LLSEELVRTVVTYQGGVAVLALSGEIDLASAPAVEHAIAQVLAEDPPSLIIDLLGVQFLGSVGLGALVKARNTFVGCDRFAVVAKGRMTSRIIQLLDLDGVLSLQETVEDALIAVNRPARGPAIA
jgi:anti-sigma B factor antagonist